MAMFKALIVALSMCAGNYAYQWGTTAPDYAVAAERSFFQAIAIVAFVIAG